MKLELLYKDNLIKCDTFLKNKKNFLFDGVSNFWINLNSIINFYIFWINLSRKKLVYYSINSNASVLVE